MKTLKSLALVAALLVAASPADAGWSGGAWWSKGWSKAASGGGSIPSLTVPTQIGVSEPASATQFAFTPSVSVPSGQSILVYVFGGAGQANATGCASPVCTSTTGGSDALTCNADVSGVGTTFKCQGVLTHDLKGADLGGSDTIKVGLASSTGPILYAVGVPSSGPATGVTNATFTSSNTPSTGGITITPTKMIIGIEMDNGNNAGIAAEATGYTSIGDSPVVASLYRIHAAYKSETTSTATYAPTTAGFPSGYIALQAFN